MPRHDADTDSHIGRRIKLRDLQIMFSVAELGSMAKAAARLSMTQPSVSQAISDLEEAAGVRLFDRTTQGVALTTYGEILLKSGLEAFDSLKQGMRTIQFHATPDAGDVWIGCAEPTLHGFVPDVIERIAQHHPKIVVHAADVNTSENQLHQLRNRKFDLLIGRAAMAHVEEDVAVEHLFQETFCVVTSASNAWARRRNVLLSELMNEPWIFGERTNATQALISQVFTNQGLALPRVSVYTISMNLRLALLMTGRYVSCIPSSIYRYGAQDRPLKALPVDMGLKLPIALFTVKNRTLSPAVEVFIQAAREVAQMYAAPLTQV
jgi:DNA-binding transcriptional LysR family regulator